MLNSPFMQVGATRGVAKGLLKSSKFSFNGILTNIEKTVATINQVVPLYNQVKPLISNSKTLINAFKSTTNKTKRSNQNVNKKRVFDPNIIDASIKQETSINQESHSNVIFENITVPNKPFFI